MSPYTPSLEYISLQTDRQFATAMTEAVTVLRQAYSNETFDRAKGEDELEKVIYQFTGIGLTVNINPGYELAVDIHGSHGHRGEDGNLPHHKGLQQALNDPTLKKTVQYFEVDFKNARVVGDVKKAFNSRLYIGKDLFDGTVFVEEELAAFVLHEVGHVFNALATLGDYVWLNYYLTEGLEVLRGTQPNKLKVKILNNKYLSQQVKSPEKRRAINDRTASDEVYREVIVDTFAEYRRHHLGSSLSSHYRTEQLADWFVARMGMTRPLVTGLDKLERDPRCRYYRSPAMYVIYEVSKLALATVGFVGTAVAGFAGLVPVVLWVALEFGGDQDRRLDEHMTPRERLRKLRNELILQIKDPKTPKEYKKALHDDLRLAEKLFKEMNERPTLYEAVFYLVSPTYRRQRRRLKDESELEDLLNNQLFADADALSTT